MNFNSTYIKLNKCCECCFLPSITVCSQIFISIAVYSPVFVWDCFPSAWRTPYIFTLGLPWQSLPIFVSLKSLRSLLLTKNIFTAYRTWGWQLFSFSTSRMLLYYLMNSFAAVVKSSVWIVAPMKAMSTCTPIPYGIHCFFVNFTNMNLGMFYFVFILFRVHKYSSIYKLIPFALSENSHLVSLQIGFLSHSVVSWGLARGLIFVSPPNAYRFPTFL